jgi:hypothetical protein
LRFRSPLHNELTTMTLGRSVCYCAYNTRVTSLSNFGLHVKWSLLLLHCNVIKLQYFEESEQKSPHYDNPFKRFSSGYLRADGRRGSMAWLALASDNFWLLMPQELPLQQQFIALTQKHHPQPPYHIKVKLFPTSCLTRTCFQRGLDTKISAFLPTYPVHRNLLHSIILQTADVFYKFPLLIVLRVCP